MGALGNKNRKLQNIKSLYIFYRSDLFQDCTKKKGQPVGIPLLYTWLENLLSLFSRYFFCSIFSSRDFLSSHMLRSQFFNGSFSSRNFLD